MVIPVKARIREAAWAARESGNPDLADLLDRIAEEQPLFVLRLYNDAEADIENLPWGDYTVEDVHD